jgi:hypothetical protein
MATIRLSMVGITVAAIVMSLFLAISVSYAEDQPAVEELNPADIPKTVVDTLRKRFPTAEIRKATKEKEGSDVVYDIEFQEKKRKCEADIKEDGAFVNFEMEVVASDLPAVVKKTVEKKYPQATIKEIMEITAVAGKAEKLEGYEIVVAAGDKRMEVAIAPDGKILEESGGDE